MDFSKEILPILSENCFHCHGPDAKGRKGDLRLDTRAGALLKNKEGAAAIVPGNPGASTLIERICTTDKDDLMPPVKSNRKLSPKERDLLKVWIEQGATWGTHWAFVPLQKPPISESHSGNPIDIFVRERLAKEGLTPQPQAPRRTLLRRLTLDLTGLPPTAEEVANFDADTASDAIERTVDRLLASPRFGERMAWDWLDAARYADSNGYQGDNERTMWPWRDWVVNAFNRNLPYDQFTTWQIAGDLLPKASQEQVLATGFLRNHAINGEGGRIAEENRVDYAMDMAETTGTVWLGLTFLCCRCHDHKYDPLTQSDYYRFYGFFNQTPVNGGGGDPHTAPNLWLPQGDEKDRLEKTKDEIKKAEQAVGSAWKASVDKRVEWIEAGPEVDAKDGDAGKKATELAAALRVEEAKWNAAQRKVVQEAWATRDESFKKVYDVLEEKRKHFRGIESALTRVMVMGDMPKPRDTFVLNRGLYNEPGEKVLPGVPESLAGTTQGLPGNRLGLAKWLSAPENPLMARVTVNRFWQMLFGIGLVKTPEDFGVQAEMPVQKDVLDWLAAEFCANGWNVKALLKTIVTSETYLQSSHVPPGMAERDPENRLLARGPRFRMPAWMIRDQALASSGLMSGKIGGKPVRPYQPSGVWEEATFGNKKYVQDTGESLYRRSLYTFWRRIVGPTMFFDSGNRTNCSVKPLRTNTPLHALSTLNDTTFVEAGRVLAQYALQTAKPNPEDRLRSVYQRVLARPPSLDEVRLWSAGLERHLARFSADPAEAERLLAVGESQRDGALSVPEHAAYTAVCVSILNLDEALTKE